jgi:hypothetical protein
MMERCRMEDDGLMVRWITAHSQALLPPALAEASMISSCSCLGLCYMHTRLIFVCLEASHDASIRSLLMHSPGCLAMAVLASFVL